MTKIIILTLGEKERKILESLQSGADKDNEEKTPNKISIKSVLTKRELEALKYVCQGKTNVEIAKIMKISINTAKAHVGSILNKLEVSDRLQAAVLAVKENLF